VCDSLEIHVLLPFTPSLLWQNINRVDTKFENVYVTAQNLFITRCLAVDANLNSLMQLLARNLGQSIDPDANPGKDSNRWRPSR